MLADVVFILDSSASISATNFEKMKAFVGNIIRNLNIDVGNTRIGLITFSNTYRQYFYLNTFTTRVLMLAALNNVTYVPGATNTGLALDYTRTVMFTSANGDRPGSTNIVIMVTDGGSNDRSATSNAAALLRNTGATIFVVGVGTWVYEPELIAIAGFPGYTIRYITDYNNLNAAVNDYVAIICQSKKEFRNK